MTSFTFNGPAFEVLGDDLSFTNDLSAENMSELDHDEGSPCLDDDDTAARQPVRDTQRIVFFGRPCELSVTADPDRHTIISYHLRNLPFTPS